MKSSNKKLANVDEMYSGELNKLVDAYHELKNVSISKNVVIVKL